MLSHDVDGCWENKLRVVEKMIGYQFKDKELLSAALTHRSYANLHLRLVKDYERLEFIGDSVVDLLVGTVVMLQNPNLREGALTNLRTDVVRGSSMATLCERAGLHSFIRCVPERLMFNRSIQADVLEAVMGAVWIDSKSMEQVTTVGFWLKII
jgi:ribonuclease-3